MIKKVIFGDIEVKLIALSLIVLLSATYSPLSHANEQIETTGTVVDKTNYIGIELLPDLADGYNELEFIYAKSATTEYETKSIEKEAILRTIPSISTDDNKTLGLIIPPFAYFAKKF